MQRSVAQNDQNEESQSMKFWIHARLTVLVLLVTFTTSQGQFWQQNDAVYNPSGIPSLPFSQPRFADLDADGDFDMILGSINDPPKFFENTGSATSPAFQSGADIFADVSALDAEMGVCVDLDDDGDLDFITGGYLGLQYFENIGSTTAPEFQKIDDFFSGLNVGSIPVPTLADMDGDADFDLLVGLSEDGALKYYPNTGTTFEPVFLEANAEQWYDVGLYAYPVLSDLDSDGDVDLLTGRDGTGFYFYRNTGTPQSWQWQSANALFANLATETYWNSPDLVDLTGDGKLDLVYGTASGPLNYYRNTGTESNPVWTINTTLFGGVLDAGGASSPVLYDFDGDGDLDLISGSQMGDIKYYKNTGDHTAPAWIANHSRFASIDHSIYSAIAIGDVNGDGLPDAVVGDLTGSLYLHINIGATFALQTSYFTDINLGGFSVPRLVDMDGDRDLDLVVGNEDGNLFYYENVGSQTEPDWQEVDNYFGGIDVGSNCVPTLGDYDDDGDFDLFTGDLFRELQYFEHDGDNWIENTSIAGDLTVGQNAAPALGDLDGDGDLDLTVGNYDGTFNYFMNETITSLDPDPAVPTPAAFSVQPAYPNPFNPTTTLGFSLPAAGKVVITVFDISGTRIRSLVNQEYAPGQHRVRWDSRNDRNELVGTGIYFIRVQTDGMTQTRKVMLLK